MRAIAAIVSDTGFREYDLLYLGKTVAAGNVTFRESVLRMLAISPGHYRWLETAHLDIYDHVGRGQAFIANHCVMY